MKIHKINPHGYCGGVIRALKLANEAIKNNKNIYMLGKIIHNDIVCEELKNKGIIIKTNNKDEAIDEINFGTVIFTAHGTDEKLIEKAKKKNLNIIDTTCTKVNIIKNNIKKNFDKTILYIGVANHPECEAILSISNDIILINNIDDLKILNKDIQYYVTNQTTLSLLKLKDIYTYLEENFNNVIIDNKICLATTQRQLAVLNTTADYIIVVGDKASSNTNELYNIASSKCDSILVSNLSELLTIDITKYNNVKITSGASTPEYLVDEIIEYYL